MPEETPPEGAPDGRISTGNPGLDRMLEGGLVAHRPYLIVGPSGTGKTTLALQFLCEGVRRHERALLVTLEEPPNEIRLNHRGLGPNLDGTEVFDAIPDIMRYERVPFKDIASVRSSHPFREVDLAIRRSPELSAVEVTLTALEQMLRSEVQRHGYTRIAIDSLTALQYFCMKGFDPVGGAQAFLRFLSDLRVTTLLTVESPLEDVETPERMLARGEIRLFRWELDGQTVRAIGVEKFRGSPHDVRLHPYRIGPGGLDIDLGVTISRDTRQIIEPPVPIEVAAPIAGPTIEEEAISPVDPIVEQLRDLALVGADLAPVRSELESALAATAKSELDRARGHLARANSLLIGLSDALRERLTASTSRSSAAAEAYQRIVQRGEAARAGLPPTKLPPPHMLEVQLEWVLSLLPHAERPGAPAEGEPPPAEAGPPPPSEGLAPAPSVPLEAPELQTTVVAAIPPPGRPAEPAPEETSPPLSSAGPAAPTTASPPPVVPSAEAEPPAEPAEATLPPLSETELAPPGASEDRAKAPEPTRSATTSAEPIPPPAPTAPLPTPREPPPPPHPIEVPAPATRPPRRWTPPLPPSPPAAGRARGGRGGSAASEPPIPPRATPSPPARADARPPLPRRSDGAVPAPETARLEVAIPSGARVGPSAGRGTSPASPPLPEISGPSGLPTPPAAAPKRRRKAALAPRRKTTGPKKVPGSEEIPAAEGDLPGAPPTVPAAEETAPDESAASPVGKAKRRPTRKRKAPPVVAALPGTLPPAGPVDVRPEGETPPAPGTPASAPPPNAEGPESGE